MRRLTILGMATISDADTPPLGEVPRSEIDIRASLGRIENPAQRIVDRLFWLHTTTTRLEESHADDLRVPLKKAAWEHDQALNALFRTYTSATLSDNPSLWTEPLLAWRNTIESEDYWKLSSVLDQLGAFEPAASAEEFRTLRSSAMMMAVEPLLMFARQAVASDDRKQLKAVLRVLSDLSLTGDWTSMARQEVLAPLVGTVLDICQDNREKFGKKIIRKAESATENRPLCDDGLRHFRSEVEPSLTNLYTVLPKGDAEERRAREEVARCLSDIAIDFTWADRYIESEELFKDALSLAEGTLAAVQIERSLAENKGSAEHQRLYEGLSSNATQALKSVQSLCQSVLAEGRTQIIREQNKSEHNNPLCQAMLAQFRAKIQPALQSTLALVPPDHLAAKELRAEVALCLNAIATDLTWADEFVLSLQLRQEALAIGVNTDAVDSIHKGIEQTKVSARQERMYRELTPLTNTPALSTINGIGGKLYGSSDHDTDTNSFATTYYFTFFYFPIFPLRRYRVIQEGRSYRFLGRLPLRKFDKWHLGIGLGLLAIAVVYGVLTSDRSYPTQRTSYQPTPGAAATDSGTSGSSRTELKAQIDAGRARMEVLKNELEPVANDMESFKRQIEELDKEIKALDDQKASGETVDIDDYNSKVNRYNDLITRRKLLYTVHKSSLDEYQNLSKQDDALVAQYNALPR